MPAFAALMINPESAFERVEGFFSIVADEPVSVFMVVLSPFTDVLSVLVPLLLLLLQLIHSAVKIKPGKKNFFFIIHFFIVINIPNLEKIHATADEKRKM